MNGDDLDLNRPDDSVLTALKASFTGMFGLHESTQTLNTMKEGVSKSIEVLAETYPLGSKHLPRLQLMAQRIMEHGLDAATKILTDDSSSKGFLVSDYASNATSLRGGR